VRAEFNQSGQTCMNFCLTFIHKINILERVHNISEDQSGDVNHEEINMSDLFFASEILAPFNRSILYARRA
jgi:hypothetical protein